MSSIAITARLRRKEFSFEICKVSSDELGLIFGYAMVCKVDGADYYDSQKDHIPEESMLKAALDFMLNSRVAKEQHAGGQVGDVVFGFPLTEEIAESLGLAITKSGFLVAVKATDREVLKRAREGAFGGFSIGGYVVDAEESSDVDED